MLNIKDYDNSYENKWCPGCGNFGILNAMKDAFVKLGKYPHEILIVSGIGQAAKTPHFMNCNMFHSLHGRALPIATGAKIANHNLMIIVSSGDGDCYGEGGNHFIHAIRRNIDITVLVHNNKVYGLTKGQASPTADIGVKTKSQPNGVISEPFNPLHIAISLEAGFVARGFSGNKEHLSILIQEGIKHKGFSLIDILQPCVSFNKMNTFNWYKKRVYEIDETSHDMFDYQKAIKLAKEWKDKIPIGILYKNNRASYTEQISSIKDVPLILQKRRIEKEIFL
ncbi:MAG: 2-oxoacid:ferredoxin oxidoreductase subunit beta [Desulfobacterales bacterium]|nr:2-oxoacid:ferredoxin oxidoreductase subunit beta [Desulfobacterales bacterium]